MIQKERMKTRYRDADKALIGSTIKCPACGEDVKKSSYQKKFCGPTCKDKYWNTIKPNPKSHYSKYNVGEKSYQTFQERVENNRYETDSNFGWPMGIDEGPEGWDGHK